MTGVRFPEETGMFLVATTFWGVQGLIQPSCFLRFLFVCLLSFYFQFLPVPLLSFFKKINGGL
jgi:hypothetical protein